MPSIGKRAWLAVGLCALTPLLRGIGAQAAGRALACPAKGSVVVAFVAGYGPLSTTANPNKYDKTTVTPDNAWEALHADFQRALKSILLHTAQDQAITLVVYTNELGRSKIHTDVIEKLHPTVRERLTFVPVIIDPAAVTAYIQELGFTWEAKWAISKIFVYELLPACYNWIIQLDTDIMLVEDIRKLWDLQHEFAPDQLLGGVVETQQSARNWKKLVNRGIAVPDEMGFNSGVLLMSLERFRATRLAREGLLAAHRKVYPTWTHPSKIDPQRYYQLDQDVFNTILLAFREQRFQLPFRWNVQGCASYSSQQKAYITEAPGLFHFNCNRRQIDGWELVQQVQAQVDNLSMGSPTLIGAPMR